MITMKGRTVNMGRSQAEKTLQGRNTLVVCGKATGYIHFGPADIILHPEPAAEAGLYITEENHHSQPIFATELFAVTDCHAAAVVASCGRPKSG